VVVKRDSCSTGRILSFYESNVEMEWTRLDRHRTELALTARALEEFLPLSSAVLDCGSGPGRYSLLLASLGHRVTPLTSQRRALALPGRRQKKRRPV